MNVLEDFRLKCIIAVMSKAFKLDEMPEIPSEGLIEERDIE